MFIAHDGRSRFQIADAAELQTAQDAADGGTTESGGQSDAQPVQRWRRNRSTRLT